MKPVLISSDGIFYTVQGEGPLIGVPSVFVRLDNCNLRCKWGETECDAYYTSWRPAGKMIDFEDLWSQLKSALLMHDCSHLVITGGEPMLQPAVVQELATRCRTLGVHTTLETNGTIFEPVGVDLACLSPKLKTSVPVGTKHEKIHERKRIDTDVLLRWTRHSSMPYFFKFVIDDERDINEVINIMTKINHRVGDPDHVVFMPQGITAEELWHRGRWLAARCKDLGVRFTSRLQVDLYGNKPGT